MSDAQTLQSALSLHAQGRGNEAAALCDEMLLRDPQNLDALNLLGVVLLQSRQFERVIKALSKLETNDPKAAGIYGNLGVALTFSGAPEAALANYRKALALRPDLAQLHFNCGNALHDLGRFEEALAAFASAIRLQPGYSDAIYNRGNTLRALGRLAAAIGDYDTLIASRPDDARAHCNRAVALEDLGQTQEALAGYDRALALQPNYVEVLYNRGKLLHALGRLEEAMASHDRAIACKPDFADAHCNRGATLSALKRAPEALEAYDLAVRYGPGVAEAHSNRGTALQDLRRFEEAVASYETALRLKPDYAEAHSNRGGALRSLLRLDEALASYERAISIRPDFPEALLGRGNTLQDLRRLDEALAAFDDLVRRFPAYAEGHCSRGFALRQQLRLDEAEASYDQAISLKPGYAAAYLNRGLLRLLEGRFDLGWRDFEWRRQLLRPLGDALEGRPEWTGEQDILGKILFVHWEQGLGDTLQFCRFALMAADRGARVILSAQEPLRALLACLEPRIEIIGEAETPADFDFHARLMGLPLALGADASIPRPGPPYIRPDPAKVALWAQKLGERRKPRIGLVWNGGVRADEPELCFINERRNMALDHMARLDMDTVDFVSLQKGDPAEAEAKARQGDLWPRGNFLNVTEDIRDFSDTAALIENLDLVISVDTSTAHLAGAMGKPVWILLPFAPDWRWRLDRDDSPWLPSARLIRQAAPFDWTSVIVQVSAELARFAP